MSSSTPPIRIRIRNVLGVKRADLDLSGILLVGGINGAGKSSLIESVACAALQTPLARGMNSKKAAAQLLHRGSDAGSISLEFGGMGRRITYPSCEIEEAGKPVSFGSSLGIGSAKFMAMKADERVAQIVDRFGGAPSITDVRTWVAEHPEIGLKPITLDDGTEFDPVGELWERIETSGWDAVGKNAAEYGAKLKGRWEAITGHKWGLRLVRTYTPAELLPGEEYDLAAAQADAVQAVKALEEVIGHQAVRASDRARLQATADGLDAAQQQVEQLSGLADSLSKQAEALLEKKGAAPIDTSRAAICPHCGKRVQPVREPKRGYVFLEALPDALPVETFKAKTREHDEAEAQIRQIERELADNATAQAAARAALRVADDARKELIRLAAVPVVSDEEVEAARGNKLTLERKATAIDVLQRATALFHEWERHEALLLALSPEGIRRAVLTRKLSALNTELGQLGSVAGFKDIALTDTGDATYDERPYVLLSESERWRVDLVIASALGRKEAAKLLLVDRFDVLDPKARPGVLKLLRHLQLPALVCMTAKEPAVVPDLARVRMGTVQWIEAGVLQTPTPAGA